MSSKCVSSLLNLESLSTTALHGSEATTHVHATATASAAGSLGGTVETAGSLSLLLLTLGVADSLIDGEDGNCGLGGSSQNIDSYDLGLPNKELHHIVDFAAENVNALPSALFTVNVVDLSELVKHVSAVHARVVGKGLGDDLKGLGVTIKDELALTLDASQLLTEESGEFHLNCTTTSNDGVSLDGAEHDHDSVIQGAAGLLNVLGSTTSEDHGDGLALHALGEHVVSFTAELNFLELAALSHDFLGDAVNGGLNLGAGGLGDGLQIPHGDAASAENVSVGEVLGGQVTDGQLGEDDLGAGLDDGVKLVVDDLPLGVNNLLEVVGVLEADLGGVLLSLELKLEVQAENGGVLEALGLLLETSVGEGLFEADTLNKEGVGNGATGDLLDTDVVLVLVFTEVHHRVDDHLGEELLLASDNLTVQGGGGALHEQVTLFSLGLVSNLVRDLLNAFNAHLLGLAVTGHDD